MKAMHKVWVAVLGLLLIAAGAGWWHHQAALSQRASRSALPPMASAALVDESTYTTALRLAQLANDPGRAAVRADGVARRRP